MIAVVAPPGELRDAVVARLGDDVRVTEPADPMSLCRALEGAERMFLAVDDPVAAGDAVAAAEMALVYHCVSLRPVGALTGSSVRSTVLLDDAPGPLDVDEVAARAARALSEEAPD
ncbi:MAG TPA: hypothetical protein VHF89_20350 [Solirubrobacteraceae bacterium]|nr:hypothetical protein [Solirubrobacteraceae bacterium]